MFDTVVTGPVSPLELATFNLLQQTILELINSEVISFSQLESIYKTAISISEAGESDAGNQAAALLEIALGSISESG